MADSMQPAAPFLMSMPSNLAYLPVLRGFVEGACRVGGMDSRTTHDLVLAVNEAASNVIRHAHRGRPEAILEARCRLLADGIEVVLRDEGEPFDLAQVPNLDPAELRCGGRGVFLMRALLDVLELSRHEGINSLRMVKHVARIVGRESPPSP